MNEQTTTQPSKNASRLAEVLDQFLAALEAGNAPTREALLADYPEFADELSDCLASLEMIHRADVEPRPDGRDEGLLQKPLGDYRILDEIGRGGMGVVYEAEQLSLGRHVALKVLPFAAVLDPKQLQRFKNEAQAAAALDHPNIVHVHSVGCQRGVHYYAMQLIEGLTVADVIAELRQRTGQKLPGEGQPGASWATHDPTPAGRSRSQVEASPPPRNVAAEGVSGTNSLKSATLRGGVGGGGTRRRALPLPSTCEQLPPGQPHSPSRPDEPGEKTPAADHIASPAASTAMSAAETQRQLQAAIPTKGPTAGRSLARSAAALCVQAADALEHAHQTGIVHRDIKPSNLLVDAAGHLWITDFGLAMTQTESNLTMTGDVLGTLRYMSPEQVEAKHQLLDHRTDIYSLGITLYELVTLTPAFAGNDRRQLMRRIVEDEPRPPRQLNKAIPKDLETIILKATAKEPRCRYATAADLAADLRRFLADQPIQARRRSLIERAIRWTRRHRTVVGAAFVILVIAVAALSSSTFFIARAHQASEANLQMTCDAVEKLLDRLGRFVEDKARKHELHAVRELVQYATELEEKLPKTIRGTTEHQARMASMSYHYGRCAAWHHENDLARASLLTARDTYQHLAREHPTDYRLELGLVHYALAEVARDMGQPNAAEAFYRRGVQSLEQLHPEQLPKSLLSQDPKEIKASCDRAIVYLTTADAQREIAKATDAIRRNPASPEAHERLGGACAEAGQFDKAIAELTEAIRLGPDRPSPYFNRGTIYLDHGDIGRATANWEEAALSNPTSAQFYDWLAWFYLAQGEFDLAIQKCTEAIRLQPHNAAGQYYEYGFAFHPIRGAAYWGQGAYSKAVADLSKAIQMNPKTARLYTWRGYAYWQMGEPEKALADYDVAIRLNSQETLAYCRRALAQASRGRINDALSDVHHIQETQHHPQRHRDLRVNFTIALDMQGTAWFLATCEDPRLRRPTWAAELARRSLELDAKYPHTLVALGAAYYRTGRFAAALETLQEAAQMRSYRDPAGWFFLAMTHWQLENRVKARRWYDKAVAWLGEHQHNPKEIRHIQNEAAELLGVNSAASGNRTVSGQ